MATSAQDLAQQIKDLKNYEEADDKIMTSTIESVIKGDMSTDPKDLYKTIMLMIKMIMGMKRKADKPRGAMRISESKGASNLKTFSGNKNEFKEWIDKLMNQFNIIHDRSRELFRQIIKEVNKNKRALTSHELVLMIDKDFKELKSVKQTINEDLHYILTDKTSGEAKAKVDSAESGDGYSALMNLVTWYATASGEALTERIKRLMNPGTPKKDEDISQVLDSWIKERRAISDHGVEKLPTEFQITALKIIMTNHLERFDAIERASRASVDAVQNIIDNIKDYATELRLRKMRPMRTQEASWIK